MSMTIADIIDLNNERIKVKNPEDVEKKLKKLLHDDKNQLQIVFDFDQTLTKQKLENGRRNVLSNDMIAECPSISAAIKKLYIDVYMKHNPLSVDPKSSVEEKSRIMEEGWKRAADFLSGFKYPLDELKIVAKYVADNLRDGTCDLLELLFANDVPVLIFSGGSGDAIIEVLKCSGTYTSNVKVISNFLKINKDGYSEGLIGKSIHPYNKTGKAIQETDYCEVIQSRSNAILVGDSLGDVYMVDGINNLESVIKIGYLTGNLEENLSLYMDVYDIVLIDDQTMDVANKIIQYALK